MAIRWEKMTERSQEAVRAASDRASEYGNPELLPLHLLAALLEDREGIIAPVLEQLGAAPQRLLADVNGEIERLPKISGGAAQPHLSNQLQHVLDQAFNEAKNFKDEFVSTEHLLLALA